MEKTAGFVRQFLHFACGFVSIGELAVPAIVAGALAELDQHRQVGLLPGVVLGYVMPAHAGDGGALRRTWKAVRASGGRR